MNSSYKFDQALLELISFNLSRHDVAELDRTDLKHAAVAFTLVDASGTDIFTNITCHCEASDQAAYILTTRTTRLSNHAGQNRALENAAAS